MDDQKPLMQDGNIPVAQPVMMAQPVMQAQPYG